jgi:hypothetical protein
MKRIIAIAMLLVALIVVPVAGPASAHEGNDCAWANQVWHTWTGGPVEQAPAVDDPGWNATSGNPQSPNHKFENHAPNVPYFVSHGGAGKGDWFLWTATWTCAPEPTPTPTATVPPPHVERHVDCELGVAIILTETWSPDGTSKTTTEQAPLTAAELASCVTVVSKSSTRVVDCEHDHGIAIVTTVWVYSDGSQKTDVEMVALTEKEKKECLENSTPKPTPTSKPSATPSPQRPTPSTAPPTHEPSPSSSTSTTPLPPSSPKPPASPPEHELATTGTDATLGWVLGGVLTAAGLLLVRIARKRRGTA